jgi:hypothetical protein
MAKSEEFDREGEGSVKKVVSRTGPLGILPVLWIVIAIVVLLGMVFWWRS